MKIKSLIFYLLCAVAGNAAIAQDYSWDNLPTIHSPVFRKDTFNITGYGARADGGSLSTMAINGAIADCHKKGGGVVLVPAGLWLTGPIVLQSGVNLCVDRAAILQFSGDFDQYPLVQGNWEGHPATRCQPPISGAGLDNVAITGTGIIDGNGDGWRSLSRDKVTEAEWKKKIASGGSVSGDGKTWYPTDKRAAMRPNLVVLTDCKHVLLEGATFQNSPAWCLHFLLCEDLTLRGLHVRNPSYAQNGDGTDIESCKNVLVEASTFDAGDDGICIKSGRDEEGRKRGRATENVIIRNDIVYRAHGGFVIGSEMSGGARNIFVYNCSFLGTDVGLRFKTVRGRGGIVEKIYIKNISMKNIVHQAVFLDMYYFAKPPASPEPNGRLVADSVVPVTEATPRFRDIHISGIVCDGAEEGIFIRGLPEMNIRDIYLDNMVLKTDKGVELIAARNISLTNIQLATRDTDPVIYVENSSDLHFDAVKYSEGAALLFSINGDKCGTLSVTGTDMSRATRQSAFNFGARENMLDIK